MEERFENETEFEKDKEQRQIVIGAMANVIIDYYGSLPTSDNNIPELTKEMVEILYDYYKSYPVILKYLGAVKKLGLGKSFTEVMYDVLLRKRDDESLLKMNLFLKVVDILLEVKNL